MKAHIEISQLEFYAEEWVVTGVLSLTTEDRTIVLDKHMEKSSQPERPADNGAEMRRKMADRLLGLVRHLTVSTTTLTTEIMKEFPHVVRK
jgi:hypothetical protein